MRVTISELRVELETDDGLVQGAVIFRGDRDPQVCAMRVPATIGFRAATAWIEESWVRALSDRANQIIAREDGQ